MNYDGNIYVILVIFGITICCYGLDTLRTKIERALRRRVRDNRLRQR